ncbi:MAG: FecR domain-containing protein, partial [Rhodospirillales bacterium]|nr:FecR domain-containing protein [Rhodospirillales bacterium]
MRTHHPLFRLTAALAINALLLGPGLAPLARAQAEAPAAGDPPARVGRLVDLRGTVSFHTADQTEWQPALQNYPVTAGNSFWTQPGSSAAIEVGPTHLALDQSTELDVTALDDHSMQASLAQGRAFVRTGPMLQGDTYQIATPRGTVTIGQPGRYEITAGDADHPTMVTVVDGLAQVYGTNVSLAVEPRQTAIISGTDNFQASVAPQQDDPFLAAQLVGVRPPPTGPYAPPPVVAQMTGGDVLADTGSWADTPQYGQVWYPPVQVGWAPYRHGHWAYVAPWGWTWVEDEPWGFAPFHYGRWVEIGPRWGWIPIEPGVAWQPYERPVYAPALVSFIGIGIGVGIGAAIGASVGWIPLGPREVYRPPYRVSETYLRRVNVTNVRNVTNITNVTNVTNVNNFVNRRAVTMVPAATMTGSQPVAPHIQRVTPQTLAAARPVAGTPVAPTTRTIGVTPTVARQLNLRPAPGPAPVRQAPGPVVQQRPPGVAPPLVRPGATPATLGRPAPVAP